MQHFELDERTRGQSDRSNGECEIAAGATVVSPHERMDYAE
jgi:hypothetical protein